MVRALGGKCGAIRFVNVSYFLKFIEESLSVGTEARDRKIKWNEVLSFQPVYTLAFCILVYCGVEFTLGGMYVTLCPLGPYFRV